MKLLVQNSQEIKMQAISSITEAETLAARIFKNLCRETYQIKATNFNSILFVARSSTILHICRYAHKYILLWMIFLYLNVPEKINVPICVAFLITVIVGYRKINMHNHKQRFNNHIHESKTVDFFQDALYQIYFFLLVLFFKKIL